jgi:beta-glucosidase
VWAGLLDGSEKDRGVVDSPEARGVALEVAREGIVLLKNENHLLPLQSKNIKTLSVIGPNAAHARTGGGGSSKVDPVYSVSLLDALTKKMGNDVDVHYVAGCRAAGDLEVITTEWLRPPGAPAGQHGLKGEYFSNRDLQGAPLVTRVDAVVDFDWGERGPSSALPVDNFSVRWTGMLTVPSSGRYTLLTMSDDGARLYLDDKLLIDDWNDHAAESREARVELVGGKEYSLRIEYYEHGGGAIMRFGQSGAPDSLSAAAVALARKGDAVILCLGNNEFVESEGFDRKVLSLPAEQLELLKAVSAVNKNTIVVLNSGAPVLMDSWITSVPALLEVWFPGSEGGTAVAEVLFGDVNPSGKLPMTFLKQWEDASAFGNFPGHAAVHYAEGIYVGYRHFDKKNLDVSFPFGFGLSYTTFSLSNMSVKVSDAAGDVRIAVSLDVQNTGDKAGAEVVQLYVHPPASPVDRPDKELKGFNKISLAPGEKKSVQFELDNRSLAYYDVSKKQWSVVQGTYEFLAGNSSRNISLRGSAQVNSR